ncbi:diguanylate cyclase [Glaciecola sp. KUL10]|uniref:sensor domain-containing diguanylate cyclase n=1 Tax=Glaciecola sp. (strain KUL10) TaxID=2161813 RepID=UPI000D7851F7|nr:diguanylate cyclase [Glaciecola sp. KUL10]
MQQNQTISKGLQARASTLGKFSRLSVWILMGLLALVFLMVVSLLNSDLRDDQLPKIKAGHLDISTINLASEQSIPLEGDWHFYWNTLVDASQGYTESKSIQPSTLYAPNSWTAQIFDGVKLPSKGYATYRTRIKLDRLYQHLAIKIPSMGTAYRLYIGEYLLAEGGIVSADPDIAKSQYNPGIFNFKPPDEEFTITVQVSNHEFYWGGMWHALRLSTPDVIQEEQYRKTLKTTFIVAIFFTIAAFNFIQFSLRTENVLPLLIAISCLMLAMRELEDSQLLHLANIAKLAFETNVKINFLTFYASTPILVSYFYFSFRQEYNRSVVKWISIASITLSLFVLFTSPSTFSSTMFYYQIFIIPAMLYVFWGLLKAVIRKRDNANLLMFGTTLLFATMLNDILRSLGILDTVLLVSFGLVGFIMCQNYLTYLYFINASDENKVLSMTLANKNKSLEELSHSLEEQVKERTTALAQANARLETLANEDPLTLLPNRRGLMVHIEQAKKTLSRSGQAFCLILIDFDHFKKLNDALGHDVGDLVLESGGRLMKSVIREQDLVGRWGGEEFLLLMPNTEIDGASVVAEKLRSQVEQILSEEIKSTVTITLGIAQCGRSETIESCLKRADEALYKGKELGRNRVELSVLH